MLHIVLVGNYPPDGQESMLRFGTLLHEQVVKHGMHCQYVQPRNWLGRLFKDPTRGWGKWAGYVDKYFLFMLQLSLRLGLLRLRFFLKRKLQSGHDVQTPRLLVHIADQGCAMYRWCALGLPCLITCHDLLALQQAKGLIKSPPVGRMGKCLQAWIGRSLSRATYVACDSRATQKDLRRLFPHLPSRVIYPGLHYPYAPVPWAKAKAHLTGWLPPFHLQKSSQQAGGWLLHVGSHVWYKNKTGLLYLYAAVRAQYRAQGTSPMPPMIWVSGPLTQPLEALARDLQIVLGKELIILSGAPNTALAALYSHAGATLLPSWFEGFGWPIVEAQHCGSWVITTQKAPMTELGGPAATYLPVPPWEPDRARQAQALQAWARQCAPLVCGVLQAPNTLRQAQRQRSLSQAQRFTTPRMAQHYLRLYHELVG